MIIKDCMIKRKLYEGKTNVAPRRKLYEESTSSPIFDKVKRILVGAPCYGDDGTNAEIDSVTIGRDNIPEIEFTDEDGRFYVERLDWYLDAIDLEQDDREFVEDYLKSLGLLNESVKKPAKKKLVLSEGAAVVSGVSINLTREDSETIANFVSWVRELLEQIGITPADPKAERIYIKEGILYYQTPSYIGFKPAQTRKLQTRLQKYAANSNFPTGLDIVPESGMFIMPFDISGEVKISAGKL